MRMDVPAFDSCLGKDFLHVAVRVSIIEVAILTAFRRQLAGRVIASCGVQERNERDPHRQRLTTDRSGSERDQLPSSRLCSTDCDKDEAANFPGNKCRGAGINPHAPFGARDFKSHRERHH
jgi:hypothetical protein